MIRSMQVSITQFRQEIFDLVGRAIAGDEVWVAYKGRRLQLVPEGGVSRLSRVTRLDVIDSETPASAERVLREEMTRAWERDWSEL